MIKDIVFNLQKQPLRDVLTKRCSENMQQIYKRTPMSRYDFNKAAKDIFRTSFLKNNSGGLLLQVLKGLRNQNGKLFFLSVTKID